MLWWPLYRNKQCCENQGEVHLKCAENKESFLKKGEKSEKFSLKWCGSLLGKEVGERYSSQRDNLYEGLKMQTSLMVLEMAGGRASGD